MRYGKKTRIEADKAARAFKLPETWGLESITDMQEVVRLAKMHHTIQEHHCNGTCSPRNETKEANIEKKITGILAKYGLKARFDGDPRGYTVKILGPCKTYNTWGGPEYGYGVGDK